MGERAILCKSLKSPEVKATSGLTMLCGRRDLNPPNVRATQALIALVATIEKSERQFVHRFFVMGWLEVEVDQGRVDV